MTSPLYIAVDLGAGSGRVFLAGTAPGEFLLEEIHRFTYLPSEENGHLRWNFGLIFDEIKSGLRAAGDRARELGRTIHSIGIDSWGVDYGLIDGNGELIANPVCYRDDRTAGVMERVFEKVPRNVIFERTGIQFMNFNTLFQLYSGDGDVQKAENLLLMPDLINFFLTGKAAAEYTNATTTQMVRAATGRWDRSLLKRLDMPSRILPRIIPAGADLGEMKPDIAETLGLSGVHVIAPATHDTGSAVAGAPLQENWAYISSGTWSLIGVERHEPLINRQVARHNFTNEGGAFGTCRFLKNVMGLWIFESCRREWKDQGIGTDYETILREVAAIDAPRAFVFPDDERFLNPPSMIEAIRVQLRETGQEFNDDPALLSRIIFDSLALRYASVLRTIEALTGVKLGGVQILGGGGRNRYLNQMTANASVLKIAAGPVEATVVGNILVQGISAGRFASLAEARQHVRDNFDFEEFQPVESSEIEADLKRFIAIESRFLEN
jgi:rhamnulokinase